MSVEITNKQNRYLVTDRINKDGDRLNVECVDRKQNDTDCD